ncbi:hypothetical protein LINPERHAP2_LOCUS11868 [Linum perenne]
MDAGNGAESSKGEEAPPTTVPAIQKILVTNVESLLNYSAPLVPLASSPVVPSTGKSSKSKRRNRKKKLEKFLLAAAEGSTVMDYMFGDVPHGVRNCGSVDPSVLWGDVERHHPVTIFEGEVI